MKKTILAMFLAIFFGALTSISAQTDSVTVRINQQKIATGKLMIKFVALVDDSRCPTGTTCVWAGNAKVRIRVANGRGAARFFELNTNLKPQTISFAGYQIKLENVEPHPATNVRINRNAFTATFTVTAGGK